MRLIPLLILLVSCQEVQRGPAAADIDVQQGSYFSEQNDLKKYVDLFYKLMGANGYNNSPRNIVYVFSYTMDPKYAGYCDAPTKAGGPATITFNMSYWSVYSPTQKEIVVFHEMGHCVLNRSHNSAADSNGHDVTLMHPYLMSPGEYRPRRSYYLNELFANANIPKGRGSGSQAARKLVIKESFDVQEHEPTHQCE